MSSVPAVPRVIPRPVVRTQSLTMYWMAPINNGGSPITGYTLSASGVGPFSVGPNVTVYTVSGLSANTFYTFSISAINSVGTGPAAIFRTVRTGARLPQAQTATATRTDASDTVLVSWTAPTGVSQSDITWYVVRAFVQGIPRPVRRANTLGGFTTLSISGLNLASQAHFFNVHAVSDAGYSPPLTTSQIGGIVPFIPTYLSLLGVWYDAQDLLGNGSTPANGASVSLWADKSGNNRNLTGSGPVYSTYQNRRSVQFNQNFLGYNSTPTINVQRFSFFLIGLSQCNATNQTIFNISPGSDLDWNTIGGFGMYYDANTPQFRLHAGANGNVGLMSASTMNGNALDFSMVSYTVDSNSILNQYRNGLSTGTNTTPFTNTIRGTNATRIFMGRSTGPEVLSRANVSEVIVYQTVLTPFDRQKVEGYMAWKWGLQTSLPSFHPFRSNAPASNSVFLPTMFPGLQLWLDAQDTASFTLNGSLVTQWRDKSGNGRHAIPFDNSPTYSSNALNNNACIQITPNNAMRAPMASGVTSTQMTVFVVLQKTGTVYSFNTIVTRGDNNIAGPIDIYNGSRFRGNGTVFVNNNATLDLGTLTSPTVFNFFANSSVWQEWVNGTLGLNATASTTYGDAPGVQYFYIGTRADKGTSFGGNIGEVLVYNTALTSDDRQTVEGYLAWKWGIQGSLPLTHLYKYINPLVVYTPSNIVQQGLAVNFTATNYSGSGPWSNLAGYGRNFNATVENGTPSKNADGNGVVFNGATNFTFSNVALGNAWSASLWIKRTGTNGGGASYLTQNINGTSGNLSIFGNEGSAATATQVNAGIYPGNWRYGTPITINLNIWYNIAYTWDGTTLNAYSNAVLMGSNALGATSADGGLAYRIGRRWDNPTYIVGEIGQILIYNRPLMASEVLQNYRTTSTIYFPTTPIVPSTVTSTVTYSTLVNPTNISSLVQWLDASVSSNFTLSGTTITSWLDRSGARNSTTSIVGTPSFTSNSLNGLGGVTFPGATQMVIPRVIDTNWSLFAVLRTTQPSTSSGNMWYHGFGVYDMEVSGLRNDFGTAITGGKWTVGVGTTGGDTGVQGVTTINNGSPYIVEFTRDSVSGAIGNYVNGSLEASTLTGPTGAKTDANRITIGSMQVNNNYYQGTIHEIAAYSTVLTSANRQIVEGYLAWKWGFQNSLPVAHPYFSIPPLSNAMFTPKMLPGLELWLDANDTSTITLSGTSVTGWADKSAFSKTTTISANRPSILYSSLNSKNTISFNGSSQNMITTTLSSAIGTGDYTVATLWKTTTSSANTTAVFGIGGTAGTSGNVGIGWNSPREYYNIYVWGGSESGVTGLTTNIWGIQIGQRISSSLTGSYNGTTNNSTPSNDTTNLTNTTLTIGAGPGGYYTTGEIAEVLVYRGTISSNNRQLLEGYLAWKWELEGFLPSTHPYKNKNPAVLGDITPYFDMNFDNGNTEGLVNYSAANLSTNTVTGTGFSYAVPANNQLYKPITLSSTNTVSFCASIYRTGVNNWGGILLFYESSPIAGLILISNGTTLGYNWNNDGNTWSYNTNYTPPLNTWIHVVLTISPTQAKWYINGLLTVTYNYSHPPITITNCYIGRSGCCIFPGLIDNVALYGLTLSDSQVLSVYNSTFSSIVPYNLLINFTATNYSGSGAWTNLGSLGSSYNATIENGTPSKNAAGNGVVLNGSTNFTFANPSLGNAWSVSIWLKQTGTGGGSAAYITQALTSGSNINLSIHTNGDGAASNEVVGAFFTGGWRAGSTFALNLNTWYNITYTWNGTNLVSYSNGVSLATNTYGVASISNTTPYRIGRRWDLASYIVGEIGQILLYNRAITASEVLQNYNATRVTYGL